MKRVLIGLAALALFSVGASEVRAAPITSLYNTGVDAAHATLPDGTLVDPHYTMTTNPGGTSVVRIKTSASGYPVDPPGPWLPDDALSTWIGPNNDVALDGPVGVYTYQTTFNLTGLDPSTASISGRWATDNEGVDILINGAATGNTIPDPGPGAYTTWHAFSITGGFVSGVNTLDFIIHNGGGPTGLRVEMEGTAAAVPKPASVTLLGLGALGLLSYSWRKRKVAVG